MTVPSTWYPVKSSSGGRDSLSKGVEEAAQNSAYFMRTFKKFRCLRFSKITSSFRNEYLSFEFCQGSARVTKKVTKFATTEMCLPFRNITRDRNGCAPHLIGQTVSLPLGKNFSRIVESCYQIHRLLPSDQVFIVLGHFSSL
jgi:hypothetical protein